MYTDCTRSPIFGLLKDLVASPYLLGHAKAKTLFDITANLDLTITFTAEPGKSIEVTDQPNTVWFHIAEAERLWAACYAYSTVFRVVTERGLPSLETIPLNQKKDETWKALLAWSVGRGNWQDMSEWPADLPSPKDRHDNAVRVASKWFIGVCAFLFLHEIGHLVQDHFAECRKLRAASTEENPRPLSGDFKQWERRADEWATNWLLDDLPGLGPVGTVEYESRATAICMALTIWAAREVEVRTEGGMEHPDPLERLMRFLEKYGTRTAVETSDASGPIWVMAVLIMQLHLAEQNLALSAQPDCRTYLMRAKKQLDTAARVGKIRTR